MESGVDITIKIYETIINIFDICMPIKEFKIKADQKWITPDIKAEIKIRQKLYHDKKDEEWKKQAKSEK